jgi:hypothetical protein
MDDIKMKKIEKREKKRYKEKKRGERRRILLLTFATTKAHGPYTLVVCTA